MPKCFISYRCFFRFFSYIGLRTVGYSERVKNLTLINQLMCMQFSFDERSFCSLTKLVCCAYKIADAGFAKWLCKPLKN